MNLTKLIPLCVALSACFAPDERFDEFAEYKDKNKPDAGDTPMGGAPLKAEQISGTYLYAVSIPLAPKLPTVYLAEVDASEAGAKLEVRIRQRPLSKTDRKMPVGDWSEWRTSLVDPTGTYTSEAIVTTVPAAANAVTGQESATSIEFMGTFINPATAENPNAKVEFFCGTGKGMAVSPFPINLDGATFAAIRLENPDDTSTYPDVVINCNKDAAQPL